jgi:hypothetical protein
MKKLTCGSEGMTEAVLDRRPVLDDFMKMRADPNAYSLFCDVFLPNVVGKKKWSKEQEKTEVDGIANDSDFAFGLVQLENGWDCWTKEVKRRKDGRRGGDGREEPTGTPTKKRKLEGKYTANACSAKKNGGWTVEGLRRYTAIFNEVRKDRERDIVEARREGRKPFGAWFLDCKKKAGGLNGKKQRGAGVAPVAEVESIEIANCFSTDSESSDDEGGG